MSKSELDNFNAEEEFLKIFKQLTVKHESWNVWYDFIVMSACAISNAMDKSHYEERESRYMSIIQKYSKEEQAEFPKLLGLTIMALDDNSEQDFLGEIFMRLNMGDTRKGQVFTPYHVCELMAKMIMGDNLVEHVKEKGYITINDPCCGAGATLIAGINEVERQLAKAGMNSQNYIWVDAQDIDELVALMCYIQLSLLGVAGVVKVGNSLLETTEADCWYLPMSYRGIWVTRSVISKVKDLFKDD